uniref:Uncharacterized protein n=1 Tax=Sphaerodactylus townsendi TaxID=933632 RepID=A0ACB8EKC1_9SAUR
MHNGSTEEEKYTVIYGFSDQEQKLFLCERGGLSNDIYGNPIKVHYQYEIKQIKMFRGLTKPLNSSAAPSSAVCVGWLDIGGKGISHCRKI